MATSRENSISLISKINERINSLKYGENPEMHWEEIKKLEKTKSDLYESMNGFYDDALADGSKLANISYFLGHPIGQAFKGWGNIFSNAYNYDAGIDLYYDKEPEKFKQALKERSEPLTDAISKNPKAYRFVDSVLPKEMQQVNHEDDGTQKIKGIMDAFKQKRGEYYKKCREQGFSEAEAVKIINDAQKNLADKLAPLGKKLSLAQSSVVTDPNYLKNVLRESDQKTVENLKAFDVPYLGPLLGTAQQFSLGAVNGALNLPTAYERAVEAGLLIFNQDEAAQKLADTYAKYEDWVNEFSPSDVSPDASLSAKVATSIGENIPSILLTSGISNANMSKLPFTKKISDAFAKQNLKNALIKIENGLGLKRGLGKNLTQDTLKKIKAGEFDTQLAKWGLKENEILAIKGESVPLSLNSMSDALIENANILRADANSLKGVSSKLSNSFMSSLNNVAGVSAKIIPTAVNMSFRELYDTTCGYDENGKRLVPDKRTIIPTMLLSLAHAYIENGSGVDPTDLSKVGKKQGFLKWLETGAEELSEEVKQQQVTLIGKIASQEFDNPKNQSYADVLTATADRILNAEFDAERQLKETEESGIIGGLSGLGFGGYGNARNAVINGANYVSVMNDVGYIDDFSTLRDFQSYKRFSAFTDEKLQKQPEILAKQLQDTENKLAEVKNMLSKAKSVEEQQELAKQKVELEKELVSLPETIKAANLALQERVRQKENEAKFNVLQAKELQEAEKLADLYRENGVEVNETVKPTFKNSPVDRIVSKVYDKLQKAGINVRIFDTAEQANKALGTDYAENMEGVTDKNGDIVLIRSKPNSETNARYVLGHEITHRYLRNFLGEAKYKALVDKIHDSIYSEKPNPFQNMFYEILEAYSIKDENGEPIRDENDKVMFLPQYDPKTESGQYALVEEILSRFAEMALFRPSGMKGFMKNILSGVIYDVKRGLNAFSKEDYKDLTANDVLHILRKEISSAEKGLNKGEFKGFYSGEIFDKEQKEQDRQNSLNAT